jgi:hypothetical protein
MVLARLVVRCMVLALRHLLPLIYYLHFAGSLKQHKSHP